MEDREEVGVVMVSGETIEVRDTMQMPQAITVVEERGGHTTAEGGITETKIIMDTMATAHIREEDKEGVVEIEEEEDQEEEVITGEGGAEVVITLIIIIITTIILDRGKTSNYVSASFISCASSSILKHNNWDVLNLYRYRNRDRDGRSDRNERGSNNTPYATSEDVQFVKVLKGYHSKQISSVVLDQNSGQLFTASKDGKVCVWDTRSGDFSSEVFVGAEIDSMLLISGGWLFVGINVREGCSIIRAYNMGTSAQQDMEGHTGQIYSLTANDMYLFSASQDKTIRVWKYDEATGNFGCVGVLSGHTGPVISLTIAGDYLFSASYDLTIRVWSLTSAACVQIIENAHKEAILSLLIWEGHLLSCSLDGDVKVWAPGTNNVLEVNSMFTYPEPRDKDSQSGNRTRNRSYNRTPRKFKDGALMLCGSLDMNTPVPRPVLMVAYNNGVVGLWDLPSFADRGELRFPRSWESAPIRALAVGPEGLMFTGDSKGQVCVWNWQKTQDAT